MMLNPPWNNHRFDAERAGRETPELAINLDMTSPKDHDDLRRLSLKIHESLSIIACLTGNCLACAILRALDATPLNRADHDRDTAKEALDAAEVIWSARDAELAQERIDHGERYARQHAQHTSPGIDPQEGP